MNAFGSQEKGPFKKSADLPAGVVFLVRIIIINAFVTVVKIKRTPETDLGEITGFVQAQKIILNLD